MSETAGRARAEWKRPEVVGLRASLVVDMPAPHVGRLLHVKPDELIQMAYGTDVDRFDTARVPLSPRMDRKWLSVPSQVEYFPPEASMSAVVVSLRWRPTRMSRWLPVLSGNLLTRPRGDQATELVLDGEYRPPLGTAGMLFDHLVGRWVAAATAKTFLDRLGAAIEQSTERTARSQGSVSA
jgi:hypothetical protein